MKKLKFLLLVSLLLLPISSFALTSSSTEKIENFRSDITINKDSSIDVKEDIRYNFGQNSRHGIFRYIPYKFNNRITPISNIRVTDGNGFDYQFQSSTVDGSRELKIGDPNTLVNGLKEYVISYKIKNAINYFNDHDELYWNVTGNGWSVPIDSAQATVNFPVPLKPEEITSACYFGLAGSKNECEKTLATSSVGTSPVAFKYFAQTNLGPSQGMTAVVGIPKNIIVKPSGFSAALSDNWPLVLPIIVLAIALFLWNKWGRDAKGRGTVIAQYDPPTDLSPMEMAVLEDGRFSKKALSAQIIYLATLGYLKITRLEKTGIFAKQDYLLTRLKNDNELTNYVGGLSIMAAMFSGGDEKKLSEMGTLNIGELADTVSEKLKEKGYTLTNSVRTFGISLIIGCVLLFGGIFFWGAIDPYVPVYSGIFGFILPGLIVIGFSFLMPAKTQKGAEEKEYIDGFKLYMTVVEKDRLDFANAPEKTPERFEKILPFAIALGVEQKWAQQFDGIYNRQPSWYSDPTTTIFTPIILTNSINDFSTTASTQVFASAAASGGSGLGGGGFSGGGFGGGGGGSW